MSIDSEIFRLWKWLSPVSAFASGLKGYAGKVWLPTPENKRKALESIDRLLKKAKKDAVAVKFLKSMRRGIVFEEPHDVPGGIMNSLYEHVLIEGFKPAHLSRLATEGVKSIFFEKHLLKKDWPAELKIMTVLECDGCLGVIATIKKSVSARVQKKLDALAGAVKAWRKHFVIGTIKKGDFIEVFPLLKKHGSGFGREKAYPGILRDFYDYKEKPADIERLALGWLKEELPRFRGITAKLAAKNDCKPTVEVVEGVIKGKFPIERKKFIKIIAESRKLLQRIAEKHWVRITPKYDVRLIETPSYLVPFLPTAAMNTFKSLTKKPFCVFFATTDPRGSPSNSLPEMFQTIIHEEYGHCVNFLNSYKGYKGRLRLVERLGSSLDTPITEGLSFHREIEALGTFRHLEHSDTLRKDEYQLVSFIEKHSDLEAFNDCLEYVVRKWRVFRFLRAISDSRVNSGKQRYASFVEWAAKLTGLPKKLIYDQTFFFQEHAGYAPCYSIFGQRLAGLQKKALKKGVSRLDFNTFVASRGFPARTLFEKEIVKKFRL